ncbi:MAG TPA: crotonase/enoyl-CoA hydratase family protein [Steroidobacteraceae bacterium]|jgi:DSF synthase
MNAIVDFPVFDARAKYETLQLEYVRDLNALFSWMTPSTRACFSSKMLHEIEAAESLVETHQGHIFDGRQQTKLDYVIFGSKTPGVFNLGGDLEMFTGAILRRDRDSIRYYAKLCIDNVYRRHTGFGAGVMTIALVQGKALGGGFECALACDYIFAERSATFALPEVLFNLFPGMGAMSFLTRRVGLRRAEEICLSGETYSAREMHEMGVVDHLVDDESGLAAVRSFIGGRQRRSNAARAIAQARALVNPIPRSELNGIVDVWVDAALRLDAKDLRMMARLVRAQDRLASVTSDDATVERLFAEPLSRAANG